MGKKGKGSKKKKDDEKKKKKKKKKDDTHTSKESSVTVPNQPTAVPMKKFMVLYMASGPEFERMRQNSTPEARSGSRNSSLPMTAVRSSTRTD